MTTATLSFVTHFRALSRSARKFELQAQLQVDTLRVEVSGSDRYVELEPEFATLGASGAHAFSGELLPQSRVFAGWRCGPRTICDTSTDKLAFSGFCARNHLRTPRTFARASEATTNVVIKQVRPGSRGIVRGPFAPGRIPANGLPPPGDFLVQDFVPGHMLEAWYWGGELFAVEVRNRAQVVGDGVSDVRELIDCNSLNPDWIDWIAAEDAVGFQGASLDTVLPAGKDLAVDIRFNSALQAPAPENVLEQQIIGTPVHEQLKRAGAIFGTAIPTAQRAQTQFVLGAIIDAQQALWFTDMDTDLRIHPNAYEPMLRGLFGLPVPTATVVEAPAPLPAASSVAS
jgi:hypothetical protein